MLNFQHNFIFIVPSTSKISIIYNLDDLWNEYQLILYIYIIWLLYRYMLWIPNAYIYFLQLKGMNKWQLTDKLKPKAYTDQFETLR